MFFIFALNLLTLDKIWFLWINNKLPLRLKRQITLIILLDFYIVDRSWRCYSEESFFLIVVFLHVYVRIFVVKWLVLLITLLFILAHEYLLFVPFFFNFVILIFRCNLRDLLNFVFNNLLKRGWFWSMLLLFNELEMILYECLSYILNVSKLHI